MRSFLSRKNPALMGVCVVLFNLAAIGLPMAGVVAYERWHYWAPAARESKGAVVLFLLLPPCALWVFGLWATLQLSDTLRDLASDASRGRRFLLGAAKMGASGITVVCGILVFLWAVFPGGWGAVMGEVQLAHKDICMDNQNELLRAIQAYAREHDGGNPPAETWCDAIAPYVRVPQRDAVASHIRDLNPFCCPAHRKLRCAYALNSGAPPLNQLEPEQSKAIVLIFESDAGWNAAGGAELLPDEPRHKGGDNYIFGDGHFEWVPRKKLPDGTWVKEPHPRYDWVTWEPVLKESEGEQPPQADP